MRRTIAAGVAMMITAATLAGFAPSATAADDIAGDQIQSRPIVSPTLPDDELAVAERVLSGKRAKSDPSATVALRDLWQARPHLSRADRRAANRLLARPTDGMRDPIHNGYTVPSTKICNPTICLHYVETTADAPPSLEWANYSLQVMQNTWDTEVGGLGYRAPVSDGTLGGGPQFDVYLKDLGTGLYGYCASERRAAGNTASGYCVLDNDYAPAQFPSGTPEGNLRVTAAHEFFHAIHYAYDVSEDGWLMEATATWMEERVATDVNDNRQYFSAGQMMNPLIPLDVFSSTYGFQYGNWVFFEYLSNKYGTNIVRKIWEVTSKGKNGGRYSLQAITKVLRKKGGFTKNYATFVAGNLVPAQIYPEGAEYPTPAPQATKTLSKSKRKTGVRARLSHLTGGSIRLVPAANLSSKKWKVRLSVRGPARQTSPAVAITLHKANGKVKIVTMRLSKKGNGSKKVPFNTKKVTAVTVSLVNASTRMTCNRNTVLACEGKPRDDKQKFLFNAKLIK